MGKKISYSGPRQKHFLREWRDHRGLTLEQLADRVDTSKVSISRIERGAQPYTEESLHAIADALGCSPADLISRDPKNEPLIPLQSLPEGDAQRVYEFIRALRITHVPEPSETPRQELPDTPAKPVRRGRKVG